MTQSPEAGTNPEEVPVEGVETKGDTSPTKEVDKVTEFRSIQSQLDKERTEREKLVKDTEYLESQLNIRLSEEQRIQFEKDAEARRSKEEAEALRKQLQERESAEIRNRLIAEKYPHLKDIESISQVVGTKEEIEAYLADADKVARRLHENLAKEESAKSSASPLSPQVEPASLGVSFEELEKLKPEAQEGIIKKMTREWMKGVKSKL